MSELSLSTIFLVGTAVAIVSVLTIGVAKTARRAGFDSNRIRTLTASVAVGLSLWLVLTAGLALCGAIGVWSARPPRLPLLPLGYVSMLLMFSQTKTFKSLLASILLWQPVAFQTFRVAVELILFQLHAEGKAPIQVTFEGSNFDGLVGLTAPIVAVGVGLGCFGKRTLIGWNVFGIALLATAIWASATSVPGPLHIDWPGEPFTAIATWPVVWIPAFFAPTALFMHITSIRLSLTHPKIVGCEKRGRNQEAILHGLA